jgi:TRAP-type mannitol/chloroaromatic compound transport system substrate-binding protein
MKIRLPSICALVATGLIAVSPGSATAQTTEEPLLLQGQSTHPATANLHLIFELWADTVEEMTNGRVKIETLPAGAVVPPFEVFDATSRGVLHVGMGAFGYILGKSPATIPLSHGPLFGMDGTDFWGWYYEGGGNELLDRFFREEVKLDVHGFYIPTDYPQGLGWFRNPITSLDDLRGMKFRIYGIGAETFQRLGVSVVTLPGGEIVPALERGVIDGAEWINCAEDQKLGLNDVATHYYAPGMHEPVTGGHLMINRQVWEKLPPDIQKIMEVAAVYATTRRNQKFVLEGAEACQELIAGGTQMYRTPDAILQNFLDEWEKISAGYAEQNPLYKNIIESQKSYANRIVPYRLSWYPDYDFIGNYYWADEVYAKEAE